MTEIHRLDRENPEWDTPAREATVKHLLLNGWKPEGLCEIYGAEMVTKVAKENSLSFPFRSDEPPTTKLPKPFPNLGFSEHIAHSSEFPNLQATFGYSLGVGFDFPERSRQGRRLYLFSVEETLNATANWKALHQKEVARLDQLVSQAAETGCKYLIIHVEAAYHEAKTAVEKLLKEYDDSGTWIPGAPDAYHDSGYSYSQDFLRNTPVYLYISDRLRYHKPPIYAYGENNHNGRESSAVLNTIETWVTNRYQKTKQENS